MFSWDFNTATLTAIGVQIVFMIAYLVKTSGRAQSAYELAAKALVRADDAHDKIALVNASVSLVREQFVHNDDLDKMEARLTTAINKVGDRLDEAMNRRLPKAHGP